MTDFRRIAIEILELSPQFEPQPAPDGMRALEELGSLAELAQQSLAVPAPASTARVSAAPTLQRKVVRATTETAEYSPALEDPHLVEALMQLHAQAFAPAAAQAQPKLPPVQRTRAGTQPQIFRPLK